MAIIAITLLAGPIFAVQQEDGGEENFLSSAISSAANKLNQYTSGEKDIMLNVDEDDEKYRRDAMGRDDPAGTFRSGNESTPKGSL